MPPRRQHQQIQRHLEPLASSKEFDVVPAYDFGPLVNRLPSTGHNYTNDLPSPPSTIKTSPPLASPPHHKHSRVASPPISRSTSLNGKGVGQADGWRDFTTRLRQQFLGEKAHMEADRARAEEVMAEERALWDKERVCYEERIADLEAQLAEFTGPVPRESVATTALSSVDSPSLAPARQSPGDDSDDATPKSNSVKSPLSRTVTQESGRNPDGSPFYAPASQHPSRTFESIPALDLRVDSMFAPDETPLRVTSKELTESDFQRSPTLGASVSPREDNVVGDSIDISFIQPELEGVPIKSSAVAPTFAAQVRSPSGTTMSPNTFSPDVAPPPRPTQSYDRHSPTLGPRRTREIIRQPEGRRLTMHAGHTPNHSVIHFELGESEITTPKVSAQDSEPTAAVTELAELSNDDPELKGPLGLINDAPEDQQFLAALTSKLEEVAESAEAESKMGERLKEQDMSDAEVLQNALRAIGRGNGLKDDGDESSEGLVAAVSTDDIPMLKFKQTPNFERPLGSL